MTSLTRGTLTTASRIMLPADATFGAALGLTWALQDSSRTNVSLTAIAGFWPVPYTGWLVVAVAALIVAGMLTNERWVAGLGLAAGVVLYTVLGLVFVAPLELGWGGDAPFLTVGVGVSLSAPYWPWYLAVAHLASLVSLAQDEFSDSTGNRSGSTV
jgi:hypothetical protein